MKPDKWMRQGHRWLSMTFTLIVAAIFMAMGTGNTPVGWVFFLPLIPLALLMLSGLWMLFLPYVAKLRGRARVSV